jgi:hypothetical protein
MGTTSTPNLNLIKPNPFEEEDSWAPILNENMNKIDTAVAARLTSTAAVSTVAGLTPAADRLAYYTGASTAALTTLTAFARSLMAGVDAAAMRATLGLGGLATLSAVGAAEITDGSVGTAELANLSVTTAKLADGAVTAAKIAAGAVPAPFPTGTRMLFQQTSAPTGWTKDATHNDKALRVVSGTVSSGGTVDFSSAFASRGFSGSTSSETVTGVVGGTALTNGQLPIHRHAMAANDTVATTPALSASNTVAYRRNTGATDANNYSLTGSTLDASLGISGATGSGETHTHSFSGGAHAHTFSGSIDMAVKYVDLIIASKD